MTSTLLLLLALPFLMAALIALHGRLSRTTGAWLAGAAPLLGLALLGALTPAMLNGEVPRASWPWLPQLGLDFTLRLDGLAWMFAGLVLGIGALVVLTYTTLGGMLSVAILDFVQMGIIIGGMLFIADLTLFGRLQQKNLAFALERMDRYNLHLVAAVSRPLNALVEVTLAVDEQEPCIDPACQLTGCCEPGAGA